METEEPDYPVDVEGIKNRIHVWGLLRENRRLREEISRLRMELFAYQTTED
jgi:hypothetical protein